MPGQCARHFCYGSPVRSEVEPSTQTQLSSIECHAPLRVLRVTGPRKDTVLSAIIPMRLSGKERKNVSCTEMELPSEILLSNWPPPEDFDIQGYYGYAEHLSK